MQCIIFGQVCNFRNRDLLLWEDFITCIVLHLVMSQNVNFFQERISVWCTYFFHPHRLLWSICFMFMLNCKAAIKLKNPHVIVAIFFHLHIHVYIYIYIYVLAYTNWDKYKTVTNLYQALLQKRLAELLRMYGHFLGNRCFIIDTPWVLCNGLAS